MLSTLIYRSQASPEFRPSQLRRLVQEARQKNDSLQITGILLFDGVHFFQVLEGADAVVNDLYAAIAGDARHRRLVTLLRDYAPTRRFGASGMDLFDLRGAAGADILDDLYSKITNRNILAYDDRVLKIVQACVAGTWRDHFIEGSDASEWVFAPSESGFATPHGEFGARQPCQFALQPIVDPARRKISSIEALIRGPAGEAPADYFATLPAEQIYLADLQSKAYAFDLVRKIGIGNCKVSVNLLPMSLIQVPRAVDILLEQIADGGLMPEQVIVEVTEEEVITRFDAFHAAIIALRRAGIGLAIDDFGAGFAGLSLLAEWQPEKLKIDRRIISGIHADGPRQAIVRAIIEFCSALGIAPVAEGVETPEEWCWLQAAGIERFQGYLFAKPALNKIGPICWPRRREAPRVAAAPQACPPGCS